MAHIGLGSFKPKQASYNENKERYVYSYLCSIEQDRKEKQRRELAGSGVRTPATAAQKSGGVGLDSSEQGGERGKHERE